jgi:hypothetical protein
MIVEMRTYTVKKGTRPEILEILRSKTFAELKRIGVRCAGPWASTEDEKKIFWMRAFPDEAARQKMSDAFYGGEAWANVLGPVFMPNLEKYDVVAVEMPEDAVKWVV